MEAGADVGGGGTDEDEAPALGEDSRASGSGGATGSVGHDGLKNESFSDRCDFGAGANSMRGVTSVSDTELEDGGAAGADSGAGGKGGFDENGDAKNACVLLPLASECSSELVGEG